MNLFKPGQHMSYQFYHSGLLVAVVENEDQSCLNCLPKRRLAITQPARVGYVISAVSTLRHGGLLSLNAWKLGPTPQNIEVVASPHSNEPSNRCPLEPAVHEVHET